MRALWKIAGGISLVLGVIGIVLPLLPTTPLILLAAFCFSKGSERMHHWLTTHRVFGPMIDDWNRNGAINKRAKYLATLSIAAIFLLSIAMGLRPMILIIQGVTLGCVLTFIWTRPD